MHATRHIHLMSLLLIDRLQLCECISTRLFELVICKALYWTPNKVEVSVTRYVK